MKKNKRTINWSDYWEKTGSSYNIIWETKRGLQLMNDLERGFIIDCLQALPSQKQYNFLDLGIGNGRILDIFINKQNLGEKFQDAELSIYGLDFAESMVRFCRKKYEDVSSVKEIQKSDLAAAPIPFEPKMDIITAIRVLKYIPEWKEVIIKNIKKSLAADGILVLTLTNKISLNSFNRFVKKMGEVERISLAEAKRFFSTQGFEIIKVEGFSILPDRLYFSNSALGTKIVYFLDSFLKKIFGPVLFSRTLFFALKLKKNNEANL